MLRITVSAETSAPPAQVLALAGTDFSAHRAKIWPNVTENRLEVHKQAETYVEVTEGGTDIARFFWERRSLRLVPARSLPSRERLSGSLSLDRLSQRGEAKGRP